MKSRFHPEVDEKGEPKWMYEKGFSLAKWWQGVLQEEKTYS